MRTKMRNAALRLGMLPFEVAIALLLLISGIANLAHWGLSDVTLSVLPAWEAYMISALAIISGVFVLSGVLAGNRRVELAGQFFLLAFIGTRLVLYGHLFGLGQNFAVTGVFYAALVWASIARIITLLRGRSLVWVRSKNELFR